MVESKLVELVVAGSNPVGHPIFKPEETKRTNKWGIKTAVLAGKCSMVNGASCRNRTGDNKFTKLVLYQLS